MSGVSGHRGDTLVLPREQEGPSARAAAWSQPGPRRDAQKVFLPRRTIPGVIVAAVLAVAGILGAVQAVSAALGQPLWRVSFSDFPGPLQSTVYWDDTRTLAIAAAVAFAGLLLILIGVLPGRLRAIPVASGDGSVVIGVPRADLRRSLSWLAQDVAGIESATVRVGRGLVTVRATTRLRDTTGLRDGVQAVVQERLATLDPLCPLRVSVRLRAREEA